MGVMRRKPPPNVARRCGTGEGQRGEALVAGGPRAARYLHLHILPNCELYGVRLGTRLTRGAQ